MFKNCRTVFRRPTAISGKIRLFRHIIGPLVPPKFLRSFCKYSKCQKPTNVLSPSKGLLFNFLRLLTFEIPYFFFFSFLTLFRLGGRGGGGWGESGAATLDNNFFYTCILKQTL